MINKILNTVKGLLSTLKNNKKLLLHFFSGQLLSQIISFYLSYLVIRWLTVEEQAKYTFVFSIQTLFSQFTDLGITTSLIALIGINYTDKNVAGRYISAALSLRKFLTGLGLVVFVILVPSVVKKQVWSWQEILPLMIISIITVFFNIQIALKNTLLQLNKDIKSHFSYLNQSNAMRLIFITISHYVYVLNTFIYLIINLLSAFFQSLKISKKSKSYYNPDAEHLKSDKTEIINYIKPLIPSCLFFAFQGQISIFLISYFGNTSEIADLGVLSRLAQFFTIISSFYALIVNPHIAKIKSDLVKKTYIKIFLIFVAIFAAIILATYFFPDVILIYLGEKYRHLRSILVIYIASISLIYLNYLTWGMNVSRKWQRSWFPIVEISGTLALQIIYLLLRKINGVVDLILMNIIVSIFILVLQFIIFRQGYKDIAKGNNQSASN